MSPAARVELHELDPGDVSDRYVAWLNDPKVNRFLESRFVTHTADSVREFVTAMAASEANVLFGIFLVDSRRHIGNIKIGPVIEQHRTADVGLLIGEQDEWGKGYASEAIAAASAHAFDAMGVQKLTAGCYDQNLGSARAFEKAGWRREGVRRSQFVSNGRRVDEILLGAVAP